jgi:hypothetical protein
LLDPRLNGIHHALELGEKAVPVDHHDTSPVVLDPGTNNLEMGLQGVEGPRLIQLHEAAILCGIGAQDGGKLPFLFFSGQRDSPSSYHFLFDKPPN